VRWGTKPENGTPNGGDGLCDGGIGGAEAMGVAAEDYRGRPVAQAVLAHDLCHRTWPGNGAAPTPRLRHRTPPANPRKAG